MEEQKNTTQERIEDLGAGMMKTGRGTVYILTVIGQIEGHQVQPETVKTTKYEHVLPLLATIEESEEIDGLLLLLNTVGGDIEAGLAISEHRQHAQADGFSGARRGTFHRNSARGVGAEELYRAVGQHDDPSGADLRRRGRLAGDLSLFSEDSGADHGLCHGEFPYQPGKIHGIYDGHRADRHGRGNDRLRQGSRGERTHRPVGRPARCA